MHARNPDAQRATFNSDAFKVIAEKLDLTTELQKSDWIGVAESTFNRVDRGLTRPGGDFMRRMMTAVAEEPLLKEVPEATYDALFPGSVKAVVAA